MAIESLFGKLPEKWETTTLSDICQRGGGFIQTGPFGSQLHAADYVEIGIPTIMPKNIGENKVIEDGISRITQKDAERLSKYRVKSGDIVYSRRGDVTLRALIREQQNGWLCGTGSLMVRLGEGIVDPVFVSYYLSEPSIREWIQRHAVGATMPNLNTSIMGALPFIHPPLPEQRAIAGILGALDDKIELNRRMNRTLESMARAVFAEMMKDEGGGMKVGTVGEDFNLTMGQSPPGETYNENGEGIPFFQGRADFGFRYPENRVYCTAPTRFAKAGNTLVSVRAPVGDVNMAKEACAIGRGVAAIRHKTGSRSYTYYAMKSLEEDFAKFEAEGTVFGSINRADFQNLEIGIPTTEQVEEFEKICYPIDQMIENNEKESRTLASLRDTLLPKLMRGEVRVKA